MSCELPLSYIGTLHTRRLVQVTEVRQIIGILHLWRVSQGGQSGSLVLFEQLQAAFKNMLLSKRELTIEQKLFL